jgi:hypothetical protein
MASARRGMHGGAVVAFLLCCLRAMPGFLKETKRASIHSAASQAREAVGLLVAGLKEAKARSLG